MLLCRNKLVHFLLSENRLCATLDQATHDKLLALVSEEHPRPKNVTVRTSQTPQHYLLLFLNAVYLLLGFREGGSQVDQRAGDGDRSSQGEKRNGPRQRR